jgi:predicted transcriptional regulator
MVEQTTTKVADEELLRMTADVVAAYVSNNALPTAQLAEVINAVYGSLRSLDGSAPEAKSAPDEYRAKWGLPADYPMVAPNYAEQRSQFAKKIGLGRATGRQNVKRAALAAVKK